MIAANRHYVRLATEDDAFALSGLAELDSQQPLAGRVLVGQINGTPAAALSLRDGRVIADPFQRTDHLVAALRMRAGAIRAFEVTPSLRERLLVALPAQRGSSVTVYP
jgi:hypothetical protein